MEFQFDANQDYQLQAIQSITNLFEGQPYINAGFMALGDVQAIGNRLDIDDEMLLENLWQVQSDNALDWDDRLLPTENLVNGANLRYYNFSVEMETGTGKTYIYLRTALELYRKYGFRKFVIVVPSIAIREGLLKTLQVTKKHFQSLYQNLPYRYYDYDSKNLSRVRQFALSNSLELMVLTIDAFNKDLNIMRQPQERLQGDIPIRLLQATRPILILDEPQTKMEGEKNKQALGMLHPLLTLRYSATHRKPYNRVYRLTPFDAYRQRLVKKVDVWGVSQENDPNRAYIEVCEIRAIKRTMRAKLKLNALAGKSGNINRKTFTVKPGDDLYIKTKLPEYQDYRVDRIERGSVYIVAGLQEIELALGERVGEDEDAIFRAQIYQTIEEHFRRDNELRHKGIKVLSLFFIDRVANYKSKFCDMFDHAYAELAGQDRFSRWRQWDPQSVRGAYFAKRTKKKDDWGDTGGESAKDKDAYTLIMRDKEGLLSFDEPTAFIFSHSALNEGWDNPNIFQICTLRAVKSHATKRQQIGRGIRLSVNQRGERLHDESSNVLTVIANESYQQFVKTYQQEIEALYGSGDKVAEPGNARERKRVIRNKAFELDPNFQELWKKIKRKTRYSVKIDSEAIVESTTKALIKHLDKRPIQAPRIRLQKGAIDIADDKDRLEPIGISSLRADAVLMQQYSLPNLVQDVIHSLNAQRPPMSLSRQTILAIVKRSGKLAAGMQNPKAFAMRIAAAIRDTLNGQLVCGIQYECIDECYEMCLFDPEEFESAARHLPKSDKSIYDRVECDSQVEVEFARGIENRQDIPLYIKLPFRFKVATPVGAYNPDWAIVVDKTASSGEKCYLVSETKGGEMRPSENIKTEFAERHFDAIGIGYAVITPKDFESLSC